MKISIVISEDPEFEKKIQQAKDGGPEAIAALLEIYRPWLLRLAEKSIQSHLRPRLAASDVVQGSIILAIKALPNFRGNSKAEFHAWLKTILNNHLVDRVRAAEAQKRGINTSLPMDKDNLVDIVTPSQIASTKEEVTRVLKAIAGLEEKYRVVLELRYLHGLTFDAIGQQLGMTRDMASRRWQRAIQLLARRLG